MGGVAGQQRQNEPRTDTMLSRAATANLWTDYNTDGGRAERPLAYFSAAHPPREQCSSANGTLALTARKMHAGSRPRWWCSAGSFDLRVRR